MKAEIFAIVARPERSRGVVMLSKVTHAESIPIGQHYAKKGRTRVRPSIAVG